MNKMQEHLLRAGKELGLKVIAPFELTLPSGRKLVADVLLPDLGHPKGTIVTQSSDDWDNYRKELRTLGYGISSYGEPPPSEDFDLEGYAEMFSEWGWGNVNERKPDWMK